MIEKLEELLNSLNKGTHEVEKDFSFHQPDSFENSESFKDDITIIFDNYDISCDIEWSYNRKKGQKGDHLTPDDSDVITLDYIDAENFSFSEDGEEHEMNLDKYPKLKKIFLNYIIELLKDGYVDEVDPRVYKYYLKENRLLKFSDFIS